MLNTTYMDQIAIHILSGYYICSVKNEKIQTKNASRFESLEKISSVVKDSSIGILVPIKSKEINLGKLNAEVIDNKHILYDESMKAKAILSLAYRDEERETQLNRINEHIKNYEDPGELIIKSALLIDDLIKAKSMLSNRLRNMLSAYYPEPSKEIEDSAALARIFVTDEKSLEKTPFARKIDPHSRELLKSTAEKIMDIEKLVEESQLVTAELLKLHYPAFTRIATEKIAARLLRETGSMRDLAFMPASKLQLIGAEKALFRHLRNKRNLPPKHGLIHEHPLMQTIPFKNKGKAARVLADKMTIAARLDFFKNHDKKTIKDIEQDLMKRIDNLRGAE